MEGFRFYHIEKDGNSIGIYAGGTPGEAVLEMSWNVDPGGNHDFLLKEIKDVRQWKGIDGNKGLKPPSRLKESEWEEAAEIFVNLSEVAIEDLEGWSNDKLDKLVKKMGLADWSDFLHVRQAWPQFSCSKIVADRLLCDKNPLARFGIAS